MDANEVARLASVSRSTASCVLNNQPRVKEATRKAVLRVVEELNYVPSLAARSLASRRNHLMGILVYNTTHSF